MPISNKREKQIKKSKTKGGRALARAKLCQLLTGSYAGRFTNCCDCTKASGCKLSVKERDKFSVHSEVRAVLAKNRDEFDHPPYRKKYDANCQEDPQSETEVQETDFSEAEETQDLSQA